MDEPDQEAIRELHQARESLEKEMTISQRVKASESLSLNKEALQTDTESAKVIKTLREELAAQEVLREKEREQRRLAEVESGGW